MSFCLSRTAVTSRDPKADAPFVIHGEKLKNCYVFAPMAIKVKSSQIEEEYKAAKIMHYRTGINSVWVEYNSPDAWRICFDIYDGERTEVLCLGDRIDASENMETVKLYEIGIGIWEDADARIEINRNGYIKAQFGKIERVFEVKHLCKRKSVDLVGMRYDAIMATDGTIYVVDCIDFRELLRFDDPLKFGHFVFEQCVDGCAKQLRRRIC